MRDPHCEAMPDFRWRRLTFWQRADFLVVNQQSVGVLDLEVMRICRIEFHDSALDRIVHYYAQRFPEKPALIFQFFGHLAIRYSRCGYSLTVGVCKVHPIARQGS